MATTVKNAAAKASLKFARNLSFILQSITWVAAIVVSEIKDKLSPNIAPPSKEPANIGKVPGLYAAKPTTIGPKATIHPTEVPIEKDKIQEIIKTPIIKKSGVIFPIPKAHFITFSLGTIIGNELLCSKEHLIKTMVLIGPVLKFKLWSKFLIESAWLFRNFAPYMLFYKIFAYLIMPKSSHKKSRFYFIRESAKLGRKEFIKWVYLLKNSNTPYSKAKSCCSKVKKLYLIGKQDHLFLKEAIRANENDVHSELVVLDGCGHVCIIEKPNESNNDIFNFIKQHKNNP